MLNEMLPLSMHLNRTNSNKEKKGFLIALEGLDGSGKTTLTNLCAEELRNRGYKAQSFRNSSDYTAYWQTVVETEKDMQKTHPIPMEIDQSLHAFEFLTYVKCVLPILLDENDFVFSDRYVLGKMILININTQKTDSWPEQMLNEMFNNGKIIRPDLNLYLHVSPEVAFERILKRGKTIQMQEEIHMLKKAYSLLNKYEEHYNLKKINCEQDLKIIIKTIVDETLRLKEDKLKTALRPLNHYVLAR